MKTSANRKWVFGLGLLWLVIITGASSRETVPTPGPGKGSERVRPTPLVQKTARATATAESRSRSTAVPKPVKTPKPKKTTMVPTTTPVPVGPDQAEPAPIEGAELLDGGAVMGLSVAEISRRVDAAQAAMKDVRMDLKMEMKDSLSGTKQQVRGEVVMKNPGRVFVRYTHPTEQYLYISGGLIQMFQPAQNMVYKQKASPAGKGGEPAYLGVGHELKEYMAISRVSVVQETSEEVTLLLVPKIQGALFERMRVVINKRTWWPVQVRMQSPSVETKATFQKFRFDTGVEDSTFEFTPPDEAQIVEGAVF